MTDRRLETTTPPGWYAGPDGDERWWDGAGWTGDRRARPAVGPGGDRSARDEALLALLLALLVPVVGPVVGVVLGRRARRRCQAEGLDGGGVALAAEVVGWVSIGVLVAGLVVAFVLVVAPLLLLGVWGAGSGV